MRVDPLPTHHFLYMGAETCGRIGACASLADVIRSLKLADHVSDAPVGQPPRWWWPALLTVAPALYAGNVAPVRSSPDSFFCTHFTDFFVIKGQDARREQADAEAY